MSNSYLDIYDEQMRKIGVKSRDDVHKKGYWHKAFHCWIINRDSSGVGWLIFQRRSKSKDLVPNSLDITAAGHLESGERPEDGLRELREELGVTTEFSRLVPLGIHVEVYCDEKTINREFDYVYLFDSEKSIEEYVVDVNEVSALTIIKIEDGILLFSKQLETIDAYTVRFDSEGLLSARESHEVKISDFAGRERNNYFVKILLLARAYYEGERLLYI